MADEEIKIISANTPQDIAFKLCKNKPPADVTVAFRNSPVYLKKGRSRFQARRKEAVKFDYAYSSDSNEEDDFMGNNVPRSKKARSVRIKSGLGEGGVPEYSDLEGVVVEIRHGQKPQDLEENWSPLFLRKHQHLSAETSLGSDRTDVPTPPVPLAAPATPTLLKASDRGSTPQHAAFRSDARPQGPPPPKSNSADGLPKMRDVSKREEHQWDEFWKDVKDRAGG
jgi:hypothetical protein